MIFIITLSEKMIIRSSVHFEVYFLIKTIRHHIIIFQEVHLARPVVRSASLIAA